ncbi:hypothetical protein KFK09_023239 [Dendrobium nobile]|uniref:Uncharacterized protein n=1 Tax=Dendrobium nobile TaxID=94219 RepID=A0A8T3AKY8_DENNO|nr:hypothetical protein KFK09_023239 [Dendrobium nobile]
MASASLAAVSNRTNPRAFSSFTSSLSVNSLPFAIGNLSRTVALSRNFQGLRRRSEPFYSSPLIWASRVPRSFVANAASEVDFLVSVFVQHLQFSLFRG